MRSNPERTVHMNVTFSDRRLARPFLDGLGRGRALSMNILRGRITAAEASLELEVTGSARRIDHLVRQTATWGASVGPLTVGGVA